MASGVLVVFGGKKQDDSGDEEPFAETKDLAREEATAPASSDGRSQQPEDSSREASQAQMSATRMGKRERRRKLLARVSPERLRGRT